MFTLTASRLPYDQEIQLICNVGQLPPPVIHNQIISILLAPVSILTRITYLPQSQAPCAFPLRISKAFYQDSAKITANGEPRILQYCFRERSVFTYLLMNFAPMQKMIYMLWYCPSLITPQSSILVSPTSGFQNKIVIMTSQQGCSAHPVQR